MKVVLAGGGGGGGLRERETLDRRQPFKVYPILKCCDSLKLRPLRKAKKGGNIEN